MYGHRMSSARQNRKINKQKQNAIGKVPFRILCAAKLSRCQRIN